MRAVLFPALAVAGLAACPALAQQKAHTHMVDAVVGVEDAFFDPEGGQYISQTVNEISHDGPVFTIEMTLCIREEETQACTLGETAFVEIATLSLDDLDLDTTGSFTASRHGEQDVYVAFTCTEGADCIEFFSPASEDRYSGPELALLCKDLDTCAKVGGDLDKYLSGEPE